jgi:tRNA (cytidine/uridine-2'-O-)-methyltransferase
MTPEGYLKLRTEKPACPFRIVLIEPEIPPNTGAIARTCAATSSALHLVGPLGFRIDEHAVRRAGIDYWHLVDLHRHDNIRAFCLAHPSSNVHLYSGKATRPYWEADIQPGDALVFGKESVGLSDDILTRHPNNVWAIPTSGAVRSLNLSNAVAIVLYDALRRSGALENTFMGP